MIHEVRVYSPSGKLQKVISRKTLMKRSDMLAKDPFLVRKKGRPSWETDQRKGLRLKRGFYFFNKATSLLEPLTDPHPNEQTPCMNLPIYRFD